MKLPTLEIFDHTFPRTSNSSSRKHGFIADTEKETGPHSRLMKIQECKQLLQCPPLLQSLYLGLSAINLKKWQINNNENQ